jgi:phage terminase Nu1 subunit (DNA packaging protein)
MAKKNTQQVLAELTGLTQQRISQLQQQGIIVRAENPIVSNRKIIEHLGKVAAGWQSQDGRLDRMQEAALLDRIRREEIELRLAEKRGNLLPNDLFIDGVSATFTAVKVQLLGIPSKLGTDRPNLTTEDLLVIQEHIHEGLAELTYDRFPRGIRERLEAERARLEAPAPTNGKPMGRPKKKTEF